jgi:hypothetical protein
MVVSVLFIQTFWPTAVKRPRQMTVKEDLCWFSTETYFSYHENEKHLIKNGFVFYFSKLVIGVSAG